MSFLNRFVFGQPQDTRLGSVVRNLRVLLNSKRGYGSLLCNFGTGDYLAEHGGRNALRVLAREMQETIQLYEPRLRIERLRALGRDDRLRIVFELTGQLTDSFFAARCQIFLFVHPISGQIDIEVDRGA